MERLALGCVPRSVSVILEADLVDKYTAGDDVVVVGQVLRQWKPVVAGARCAVDIAIRANSVTCLDAGKCEDRRLSENDKISFLSFWKHYRCPDSNMRSEMMARNLIVKSMCPQLYGLFYVKLAVLLTLIGGTATREQGGLRRRQQSHLLLVGDPGCGKSQILKYACSLVPRSVSTTGIGTTGAGLTASAFRDEGEWCLEAGALVLSNNGLCCIDEFSSIRETERATIHEAMEQQTVSIAKAGLIVKLNARSSVIACCNPKGGTYDISADLSVNTAIASPLLSRFDLVLVLLDNPDKQWDMKVSEFLLRQAVKLGQQEIDDGDDDDDNNKNGALEEEQMELELRTVLCATFEESKIEVGTIVEEKEQTCDARGDDKQRDIDDFSVVNDYDAMEMGATWGLQALRQYISYVKGSLHPPMGNMAKSLLSRYYQLQRQSDDRSNARTTVRLLESLVRLSEAHAKLMCHEEVMMEDAVIAITLVSLSESQDQILDRSGGTLHAPFPPNDKAQTDYQQQEDRVLALLHTSRDKMIAELKNGNEFVGQQTQDSIQTLLHGSSDITCEEDAKKHHQYQSAQAQDSSDNQFQHVTEPVTCFGSQTKKSRNSIQCADQSQPAPPSAALFFDEDADLWSDASATRSTDAIAMDMKRKLRQPHTFVSVNMSGLPAAFELPNDIIADDEDW